jgi:predicted metalloprotease with PDZ domain
MRPSILAILAWAFAIGAGAPCAYAGTVEPGSLSAIAQPTDQAYPGQIRLTVDARDIERRIVHVEEIITGVGPNCVLLHAKWMPGRHGTAESVDRLRGLTISAGSSRLPWVHDPVDAYAFHVKMPPGSNTLDLQFDYLFPANSDVAGPKFTQDALVLQWKEFVLYPAGYLTARIPVDASITLTGSWAFATPLQTAASAGTRTDFQRVSLESLMDSPVYTGRHWARNDLGAAVPIDLNLFADRPESLDPHPMELERTCCP